MSVAASNQPAQPEPRVIEVPERLTDPRHQLDPRAKPLWRLGSLLNGAIMTAFVTFVAFGARLVILDYEIMWAWIATGVVLALALLNAWIGPNLRYRYWRYEIRADEADLQHGWLVRTRQLVPMARIQHVDTRRGPLDRRFGLASVVLFTAAGPVSIPALSTEVAADVRDRIATLANVHDDL